MQTDREEGLWLEAFAENDHRSRLEYLTKKGSNRVDRRGVARYSIG